MKRIQRRKKRRTDLYWNNLVYARVFSHQLPRFHLTFFQLIKISCALFYFSCLSTLLCFVRTPSTSDWYGSPLFGYDVHRQRHKFPSTHLWFLICLEISFIIIIIVNDPIFHLHFSFHHNILPTKEGKIFSEHNGQL